MKPERPSNMLINVFISIGVILGIFVVGALLRTVFKPPDQDVPQLREPSDRVLN